jgi:elongation factor Ts
MTGENDTVMTTYQPKAGEIKALREETSAPMMDCRKALIDAAGDVAKAKELLRERGASQAEKKSERAANEGLVASYIHAGGKIGVLVEVNSETDYVARNPKFAELSRDIAMHIAAMSPLYVDRASVPEDVVERVRKELTAAVPPGKPPDVAAKIVDGKLNKWFEEHVLIDQPFVKDDSLSVGDLINSAVGTLGEKIRVRRFTKFALGEN